MDNFDKKQKEDTYQRDLDKDETVAKRERIASPKRVKELLLKYDLKAKKSFGQNFLIDQEAVDKIVDALDIKPEDQILEIGPGLGSLTEALLEKNSNVVVIELDRDMVNILNQELKPKYSSLTIINEDFLKSDWEAIKAKKIVGNLPYYITTPIIMEILKKSHINPWESLVFTVQWEVVEKLIASPRDKDYNLLTAALNCYGEPKAIAKLPPHLFLPQPSVTSGVVLVKRRRWSISQELDPLAVEENLWLILNHAFQNRRKTLQNNLAPLLKGKDIGRISEKIDLQRRAETLSYKEFLFLAEELTKK